MKAKFVALAIAIVTLPPFPSFGEKSFNPVEHWAVLVGINSYSWGILPYSIKEIEEFRDVLLSNKVMWKDSHILLLGDAKKRDVVDALEWLSAHADENDVSIFFFVGHGCRNLTNEFLSTLDGRISDKELDAYLDQVKGKVVVIIDACYSGGFIDELKQKNRIVMTACKRIERTYQVKELQSGIFGYFLNKNLRLLTKSAEATFLLTNIMSRWYSNELSKRLNGSYYIHPQMFDGTKGFTFIICRHPIELSSKMSGVMERCEDHLRLFAS